MQLNSIGIGICQTCRATIISAGFCVFQRSIACGDMMDLLVKYQLRWCEMIYFVNREIESLRFQWNEIRLSHLRSKYFTAKLFHLAKPNFTRRKAYFAEKALANASAFFWCGRWDKGAFAPCTLVDPNPSDFGTHLPHMRVKKTIINRFLYAHTLLGFKSHPLSFLHNKKPQRFRIVVLVRVFL